MPALRAFCANSENPLLVNDLNPQALVIDVGAWCADRELQYRAGIQWLIHTQREIPTRAQVEAYKEHPAYSGRWFVGGNEPDLEPSPFYLLNEAQRKQRAQYMANLTMSQMDAISAGDPQAKCIISTGSQFHAPHCVGIAYFPYVWAYLPQSYKARLFGACFHVYPFGITLDTDEAFKPRTLAKYLKDFKQGMAFSGLTRFFLREIGLPLAYANDPRAIAYPSVVQNKCDEAGIRLWAWYAHVRYMQTPAEGYANLRDENGAITAIGDTFKAVVTQNRRAGRK